jgi:hypothetical protein
MVEKAGNRDLWSANIIDAKANKGLKYQTKGRRFSNSEFVNIPVCCAQNYK